MENLPENSTLEIHGVIIVRTVFQPDQKTRWENNLQPIPEKLRKSPSLVDSLAYLDFLTKKHP
jgi:hypothetical protein